MARRVQRNGNFDYDVCLSFAGEDRVYVESVAEGLRSAGVRVFYDRYEQIELWGKDLYTHLDDVYRNAANFCVMFVSRHYAKKLWTNHERRSAQERAFKENAEYILPARFDDTAVPGLRDTIGFVDLRSINSSDFVDMIRKKIGARQTEYFLPPVPDRLFESLGAENEFEKVSIERTAHNFLSTLRRMTDEERAVVFQLISRGCPAELPDNVHVNIDLLRRHTGFPVRKIKRILGGLQSLGFFTSIKDDLESEPGCIGRSQLLVMEWHDMSIPTEVEVPRFDSNATVVAYEMVHGATKNYCEDHGNEALQRLDFSQLSSATTVIDVH